MTYTELGYEFIDFFMNAINNNYQELLPAIKDDTMMTLNNDEGIGPEQIMYCLNFLKLHNLKIEPKNVIIQPMYWNNSYKIDYSGLLIMISGSINVLENGIMVNKNIHITFFLEHLQNSYYISNIMMRLSERSRQVNYNNYNYKQSRLFGNNMLN